MDPMISEVYQPQMEVVVQIVPKDRQVTLPVETNN
jgi:hypothetical protein